MAPAANKSFASARFRLIDWMACGPGLESREDWTAWLRDEELHKAEAVSVALTLPTMLRRRISVIGQMAFRASYALLENRIARFIFCSRHGEFQRTLNILKSLAPPAPRSPRRVQPLGPQRARRPAFDRVEKHRRSYDDLRRRRQFRCRDARCDCVSEIPAGRTGNGGLFRRPPS